MNVKKTLYLFAVTIILLIGFSKQTYASHYAGCDLTYVCLGGNDYLVTVSFYRDCHGVDGFDTITVKFNSGCSNFFTKFPRITNPVPILTTCPSQPTYCTNYPSAPPTGALYGLQKWVYQKQVTLPPCSNWVISWADGNRNVSGTLSNGPNQAWYIFATLNNLAAPCNSSPQFSNDPAAIMCSNQTSCYNQGATDSDGDSLVYSLVAPLQAPGTSVIYCCGSTPTYSATYPMPSVPPLSLNSNTGDICFHPTQGFICALAVKVEEYRHINGVPTLIGSVTRDMQLNAVDNATCNNLIPTLAGINPGATQYSVNDSIYTLDVCLGDTIDFNVYPHDGDVPAQNLTMNWNAGIPVGNWSVVGNGTHNPIGHFYWVPTGGFISNVSQCFTVNIKDDACPFFGQQTRSYCITVKGIDVKFDPPSDTLLCMGESYQIVALGDSNVVNYHWKVDGNPVSTTINDSTFLINSTTLGAGTHFITCSVDDGTATICPGNVQVMVKVVPLPNVNLGPDQTVCAGQTVVLDAGPGQLFAWQPGLENSQSINVISSGTYSVTVDGGYYTRCRDFDTVNVNFLNMPSVHLGHDTCVTSPITLDAGNPGFLYQWSTGETTQTIQADHSGIYTVSVSQQFGHNCDDIKSVTVKLNPVPLLNIGTDTVTCSHEKFIMTAKDVNDYLSNPIYSYSYHWEPSGENTKSITLSCLKEGTHEIRLFVTGCSTTDTVRKIVSKLCELEVPNVITPSIKDNLNDDFRIKGIEFFPNSTLQIFNRWGKKIFESTNYNDGNAWDGGNEAAGVYYYVLTVNYGDQNSCMEAKNYNGTITIVR